MSDFLERVKTINTTVRTAILVGFVSVIGLGGYQGYQAYIQPQIQAKEAMAKLDDLQSKYSEQSEILEQTQQDLSDQVAQNDKLRTRLKLLKVDRRMANVTVLDMGTDDEGRPEMLVQFAEINRQGKTVGQPREFTLSGDRMFIDSWVVTFDDKYVEQADELRATSLCVFKSIYGDIDGPNGGKSLDQSSQSNQAPGIYRSDRQNAFEQKIWGDFWAVCNDGSKQEELGIRASYGEAIYIKAEKGKTYQIDIRSSGGASLKPVRKSDFR